MLGTKLIVSSIVSLAENLDSSQIDAAIRELEVLSDKKYAEEQLSSNNTNNENN